MLQRSKKIAAFLMALFLAISNVLPSMTALASSDTLLYENMLEAYRAGNQMDEWVVEARKEIAAELGLSEHLDERSFLTVEYRYKNGIGKNGAITDPKINLLVEMGTAEDLEIMEIRSKVQTLAYTTFYDGQTISATQMARLEGAGNGYFNVGSSVSWGFCAQNSKSFWNNGESKSGKLVVWDNATVRKVLYYSPGSEGYTGSNPAYDMDSTTFAIGYLNGDSANGTRARARIAEVQDLQDPIIWGYQAFYMYNDDTSYQDIAFLGAGDDSALGTSTGTIDIIKYSTNSTLTNNNSNYTLAGAVYGVYAEDGDYSSPEYTVTLSEWSDGWSGLPVGTKYGWATISVPSGNYWVKEVSAPNGFALDGNWYPSYSTPVTVTGGNTSYVYTSDVPQTGALEIIKYSENSDLTNDNACYSLAGAVYGVYAQDGDYSSPEYTITLEERSDGWETAGLPKGVKYGWGKITGIPLGKYLVKELSAPKGFALDTKWYPSNAATTVSGGSTATVRVTDTPLNDPLAISITKMNPDGVELSGVPSLAGAEFTVKYYAGFYTEENLPENATRTWVIQTKEVVYGDKTYYMTGLTNEYKVSGDAFYYISDNPDPILPLGTLTIEETKPAPGYTLEGGYLQQMGSSDKITGKYVTQIKDSNSGIALEGGNEFTIGNYVLYGGIKIQKQDSETKTNEAQGAASLAGAKFTIRSLNQNTIKVDGKVYSYGDLITTLVTDKNGEASTPKDLLPFGIYEVEEVEAPKGYLLSGENLKQEVSVSKENTLTVASVTYDQVIRGNLELVKYKEVKQDGQIFKQLFGGIIFEIISKTTGKSIQIETDENGVASTSSLNNRGGLAYDTYVVTEKNTPYGYKPIKDFEFAISENGFTYEYVLENQLILSPVKLVKEDSETGKVIPVANAEFQLLDEDKNPIEMTVYNPDKTVYKTFKTDESGSVLLPDTLTVGVYYFREIQSPKGYLLNSEDVRFEVTAEADWENPLVVKFADAPAKGTIRVHKTDKVSGDNISNVLFEIVAKEDIVTPDGTLRAKKGDIVDLIVTDEDGLAESDTLYLGKYQVSEKKQAAGYILSNKKYDVELTYQNQTTSVVTEEIEVQNTPTHLQLIKTDADTGETLSGVTFKVWNKGTETVLDAKEYVTDEHGQIDIKRFGAGVYCFQEAKTVPGYVLDETIYEMEIAENGLVDGKSIGILEIGNIATKLIGTKAVSKDTGSQEAIPKEEAVIVDTVEFQDLQVGQEYTVKGILMDKATKKPLLIDGKEVTAETTFTAKEKDDTVDVVFTFDASNLHGQSIVVFEKVFIDDVEILAHEDIEDEGQTIVFPNIKIQTSALDKVTGTQEAIAKENAIIIDTVKYENLIVGQEYTVKGILMDKEAGKPLLIDGKEVTAKTTFSATEKDGAVDVVFTFDASTLKGKSVVVFESLYVQDTEVASHEDLDDKGQTISFPDSQIRTSAKEKETGKQEVETKTNVTIIDTVSYQNLMVGQKYTVKGILMDKEAGKPLLIGGKEVTAETTFVPKEKNGTVDVSFTFDASSLSGKSVVVFESLFVQDTEVASHADLNDKAQTILFKEQVKTGDSNSVFFLFFLFAGAGFSLVLFGKRRFLK